MTAAALPWAPPPLPPQLGLWLGSLARYRSGSNAAYLKADLGETECSLSFLGQFRLFSQEIVGFRLWVGELDLSKAGQRGQIRETGVQKGQLCQARRVQVCSQPGRSGMFVVGGAKLPLGSVCTLFGKSS